MQTENATPVKMGWVKRLRSAIDCWLLTLPWPNINPALVSLLAVLFAVCFLYFAQRQMYVWATVSLLLNITGDLADGAIAKKHRRTSYHGWLVDTAMDRFSEAIILYPFRDPWYWAWLVNCGLSVFSVKVRISMIQPLRLYFLVYWIYHMLTL